MRRRNCDLYVRLIGFAAIAIAGLAWPATAAGEPTVPERYQRLFAHYADSRSISEKALNLIGFTSQDVGRSFALIAGVSDYPNMGITERELNPAETDIRKLTLYLRDNEFFDEIVVLKNGDMNYQNLSYFLQSYFPKRLREFPKSRFLFAYSGHGMTAGSIGYLLTSAARNLSDKDNSIPLKVVRVLFDEVVGSGHQVLALINACYSGNFIRRSFGGRRFLPRHPGAHAITAGGSGELTWHDPDIGSGSIFFEKFFAALDGHADMWPQNDSGLPGDGVVTIDELATYLTKEIQIFTDQNQNPQYGDLSINGSKGGLFFLNRERQVAANIVPGWQPDKPTQFGASNKARLYVAKAAYRAQGYATAFASFRELADAGNTEAMNYLASMYEAGHGTNQDYRQAVHWYRKAAEAGHVAAMTNLGFMYDTGLGVSRDYGEAARWYRRAAAAGEAWGMHNLGIFYENGRGVEQDIAEAVRWYRRSAEAGNASAMSKLGRMYDEGRGVAQDYAEAFRWYRKAAIAGNTSAMSNLGLLYDKGRGVDQDHGEAFRWYRKAAEAGDAWAMNSLGDMYLQGEGIAKNEAEALRWFRGSADGGNPHGMANLGFLYENGRGVAKNYAEAIRWYRKAASAGNGWARARLEKLGEKP